jgi:hypothetical protein
MVNVTKADGRKQPFDRNKVIRTCLRMGASEDVAERVATQVHLKAYEGIPTRKVINMVLSYMRKYKPEFKNIIDLREAICILRPKPDFELFIARLLEEQGYKVRTNQMVMGKCVEHEIDAIAEKETRPKEKGTKEKKVGKAKRGRAAKNVFYVEVKHHYKPHTYTGMGVFLEAQATFEDIVEGNKEGKNPYPFTGAIVVSNTKLSNHALRYSECRRIIGIAWKTPLDHGLERMIEDNKLYPITYIRGLTTDQQSRLGDAGIVTIKELMETDDDHVYQLTRVPRKHIKELKLKAKEIMKLNK